MPAHISFERNPHLPSFLPVFLMLQFPELFICQHQVSCPQEFHVPKDFVELKDLVNHYIHAELPLIKIPTLLTLQVLIPKYTSDYLV